MANEKQEAGVEMMSHQLRDQLRDSAIDYTAGFHVLEANEEAESLRADYRSLNEIISIQKQRIRLKAIAEPKINESYPDSEKLLAIKAQLAIDVRDMEAMQARLAKELKDVTDLLPENERAAYVAGFLQHHDLLEIKDDAGKLIYAENPDKAQPKSSLYVPNALIKSNDLTPQ